MYLYSDSWVFASRIPHLYSWITRGKRVRVTSVLVTHEYEYEYNLPASIMSYIIEKFCNVTRG